MPGLTDEFGRHEGVGDVACIGVRGVAANEGVNDEGAGFLGGESHP